MSAVRSEIHLLKAGACVHPEAAALRGGSLCPVDFPALTALILHPTAGPLLWDTGYDPAFFRATRRWPEKLYALATPVTLGEDEPAARQIGRFGLTPDDIQGVIVSHFHGDHVAGLPAFPNAKILCARAGLEQIQGLGRFAGVRRGLLAGLLPADVEARAVFFEDRPRCALPAELAPFETGADLLGDGSLIAVELPGHCPGHWGLAARGSDDRLWFFVGDAAWSLKAIRENRPPPAFTTALLGRTDRYRATLADLHSLHGRAPEVVLTPSHCREAAATAEAP
ncbi:MBL fold metallo-hydrolase [Caulobacter sp. D5]|uniref:MBL fold metallo-hydrolase n=1 Tax=Caulobacter sp. D5 TaxID=357400 RepID=UPI000D73678B|nr:MBL fold metallo-hydrolase [Caulobacter sp. D5]PXA82398.1 MBL fold metallo-hydrolase [Caulobacter sp. D5]